MPRKRQRFGNLIKAYRENGGGATGDTKMAAFGSWLTGKTKIDVTRRPSALLMKRSLAKVIPFGVSSDITSSPDDYYLTSITGQARAIYAGLGGDNTVFGLTICTTDNDAAGSSDDPRFYPALARLFVTQANAALTTKKSAVTGQNYKTTLGRSGSIPFGRSTATEVKDAKKGTAETAIGNVDERDVAESILTTVKKAYTNFTVKTVTFVPEQFNPDTAVGLAATTVPNLTF